MHRILTRHGLNRLAWLDRPTGAIVRRYERARPGELVHVDIKKLGNIPDGPRHHRRTGPDRQRLLLQVHTVTQTLATPGITHKKIRPYRPQTNGKVERFNRTLLDEWAYQRPYASNDERTEALSDFLHTYNHHRCHTALGGQPPISRVNNAPGQYT